MPKDKQSELFYLVDDEDRVLGSVTRGEAHHSNSIKHRSVMIVLFNERGHLLLQKRSLIKDTFPGFWTVSTSGHVSYGQSYDEAAQRELMEELGLKVPLTALKKIYLEEEREFAFIYHGKLASDSEINFDEDEISEVRWVDLAKLAEFERENSLTPAAIMVLREFKALF